MKTLVALAAVLVLLSACRPARTAQSSPTRESELQNSLLWKVVKPGAQDTSYLFGTFHVFCKEDIARLAIVDSVMARVSSVYFEVDMSDASLPLKMLSLVQMQGNNKISDLVPAEGYARLGKYFKDSLGVNISMFNGMKPMMLQALLYPKMVPCAQSTSVDGELLNIANRRKLPIRGLESIEFQAGIFDSIPYKAQAVELVNAIDSLPFYKDEFERMYRSYKNEDLDAVAAMMNERESSLTGNLDILLYNRNKKWVQELKDVFPGTAVLVAVGAGHLPGRDGLIDLLRREGFLVIAAR